METKGAFEGFISRQSIARIAEFEGMSVAHPTLENGGKRMKKKKKKAIIQAL